MIDRYIESCYRTYVKRELRTIYIYVLSLSLNVKVWSLQRNFFDSRFDKTSIYENKSVKSSKLQEFQLIFL